MDSGFAACKLRKLRSPIDIRRAKPADLQAIKFDYKQSALKIIDNGHTIQVNYAPGSSIDIGVAEGDAPNTLRLEHLDAVGCRDAGAERTVASDHVFRKSITGVRAKNATVIGDFPGAAWGSCVDADEATVSIVDDDADVRAGLARLLRSAGWKVETFATAQAFLDSASREGIGCILLDVGMPGMSGPELHERLSACDITLPVIYLTGNYTVSIGIQAMKHGAIDFLEKPVDVDALLPVIEQAVARHRSASAERSRRDGIQHRVGELSVREREVMQHVIRGRLNKQIAADLDIALKTVKVHRGRVMTKMKVRSVAELVRLCDTDGIIP